MANGTQVLTTPRPRILTRPRGEWPVRPVEQPSSGPVQPAGTWRAQITMTARNDGKRTVAEQARELQSRIERWLDAERLRHEVGRIDPLDGRIALLVTCSSRCKHRLRIAFPDLEATSGATRVAHLT